MNLLMKIQVANTLHLFFREVEHSSPANPHLGLPIGAVLVFPGHKMVVLFINSSSRFSEL